MCAHGTIDDTQKKKKINTRVGEKVKCSSYSREKYNHVGVNQNRHNPKTISTGDVHIRINYNFV